MNMTDEAFLNERKLKELFKKFIISLLKAKNTSDIEEVAKAMGELRIPLREIPSQNKTVIELAKTINGMVELLIKVVRFVWILRVHGIAIFIFLASILTAMLGTIFYFIGKMNVGLFLIAMCGILLGIAGILISIFSSAEQKFK